MKLINSFKQRLTSLKSDQFDQMAMDLFRFQAACNPCYQQYLSHLGVDATSVQKIEDVPFMPIEFFKHHLVQSGEWAVDKEFLSSGTTGMARSSHLVEDLTFYEDNARRIFESFYGDVTELVFFALLPSYQEQGNSSLIAMVDSFMHLSNNQQGGYYLDDMDQLVEDVLEALGQSKKVFLFGVGYALLDLCESAQKEMNGLTIIETGGMKGRREEMTKDQFYGLMRERLGAVSIHSEYGMTELLSQAYSLEDKRFEVPRTMRVLVRDINDPFSQVSNERSGGLNIIDLANIHSCAFIETKDLGRVHADGSFEVLGRIDNSDIRGCNLLVE
ncbi:acyl transferase [Reichenbachiella sp. 5M10]|uniref:acyl transferase n=1 Tax=Reichenbachiella sp. 5M10 TaxID=1889772 RepID=UPI000C14891D|nr:acyl transferase [Reichenbachiella sp. 5M10]PIB36135.1 acyl transferase [Reichenbachiella sp. 5M10]